MQLEEKLRRFREELRTEYERRFPRSLAHFQRHEQALHDGTAHAVRWNEPFMPLVRRARGALAEDLDGHRWVDYWQGHFANLLGHNPPLIRHALVEALEDGHGLQSGMLHDAEGEVCERICRCTGADSVRLTTSGSLGTFYAVLLARAFTGREIVLKVSGGWHGSQPFGLKGVTPRDGSFDHLESEGLSLNAGSEIALTRFNDIHDLRDRFAKLGDRVACFLVEPVLGAGGGMAASIDYMREARRLTEHHGALLLCDEVITAFRFGPGDLSASYGVRPDLWILGKILGGGMPVAAVAGRNDVLDLCRRRIGRVKFEGGTYSAHELSLLAARTLLEHLEGHADEIYPRLARSGIRLAEGLRKLAESEGAPVFMPFPAPAPWSGGSLVFVHLMREGASAPTCPEELAERRHPALGERLLKSVLLLEDVSVRTGAGAISTEHSEEEFRRTLEGYRAAFARFRQAGLI